jgi:hypothetical protein
MNEEPIAVVRAFGDACNAHDLEAALSLCADDVLFDGTTPPNGLRIVDMTDSVKSGRRSSPSPRRTSKRRTRSSLAIVWCNDADTRGGKGMFEGSISTASRTARSARSSPT